MGDVISDTFTGAGQREQAETLELRPESRAGGSHAEKAAEEPSGQAPLVQRSRGRQGPGVRETLPAWAGQGGRGEGVRDKRSRDGSPPFSHVKWEVHDLDQDASPPSGPQFPHLQNGHQEGLRHETVLEIHLDKETRG